MPGGPISSRHNAALALLCANPRAAGFPGGERRCRRGTSLFKDCFLGWVRGLRATCTSALLYAKNSAALHIFNFEIASGLNFNDSTHPVT
jgi:hypothetical protein